MKMETKIETVRGSGHIFRNLGRGAQGRSGDASL